MNYEQIILELLDRIKTLENKVAILEKNQTSITATTETTTVIKENIPATTQITNKKINLTQCARDYIHDRKLQAKQQGLREVVLVCNDIQKALGAINRAPAICHAMYDSMGDKDVVLFAPPSGNSTTVKIKYYLD